MTTPEKDIEPVEARQGQKIVGMRAVLTISIVLALALMALIFVLSLA